MSNFLTVIRSTKINQIVNSGRIFFK